MTISSVCESDGGWGIHRDKSGECAGSEEGGRAAYL